MYVSNIIWNSILYIGFTYMYASHIIYCMVLSTWLHTKLSYEGLDKVFALSNLQTPSFKFSQVVLAPFQKFVLMSSPCKLLSQQLCKTTQLTYDLESFWNFAETWKAMSTTVSQNFNSFNFIQWDFFEVTSNWDLNIKWLTTHSQQLQTPWDFERHTRDMSSISTQNFNSINDDHKELSLSKETDFKTEAETLDTWISFNTYPNDLKFLSCI